MSFCSFFWTTGDAGRGHLLDGLIRIEEQTSAGTKAPTPAVGRSKVRDAQRSAEKRRTEVATRMLASTRETRRAIATRPRETLVTPALNQHPCCYKIGGGFIRRSPVRSTWQPNYRWSLLPKCGSNYRWAFPTDKMDLLAQECRYIGNWPTMNDATHIHMMRIHEGERTTANDVIIR